MKPYTISQQLTDIAADLAELRKGTAKAIRKVIAAFRRLVTRRPACTAGSIRTSGVARTIFPICYNKNNPMEGFNDAALAWAKPQQDAIRDAYECDDEVYTDAYVRKGQSLQDRIAQEIAMEQLLQQGLKVLVN